MKKLLVIPVLALLVLSVISAQTKPSLAVLPFSGGEGADGNTQCVYGGTA